MKKESQVTDNSQTKEESKTTPESKMIKTSQMTKQSLIFSALAVVFINPFVGIVLASIGLIYAIKARKLKEKGWKLSLIISIILITVLAAIDIYLFVIFDVE